jgi:hypothetical protein
MGDYATLKDGRQEAKPSSGAYLPMCGWTTSAFDEMGVLAINQQHMAEIVAGAHKALKFLPHPRPNASKPSILDC